MQLEIHCRSTGYERCGVRVAACFCRTISRRPALRATRLERGGRGDADRRSEERQSRSIGRRARVPHAVVCIGAPDDQGIRGEVRCALGLAHRPELTDIAGTSCGQRDDEAGRDRVVQRTVQRHAGVAKAQVDHTWTRTRRRHVTDSARCGSDLRRKVAAAVRPHAVNVRSLGDAERSARRETCDVRPV